MFDAMIEKDLASLNDEPSLSVSMPFYQDMYEDSIAKKVKELAKIATRYEAEKVFVGSVADGWEDYTSNRVFVIMTYPVHTAEYVGMQKVECYMRLNSPVEVARMASTFYTSRTVVIDRETKQIIAAYSTIF